MNYGYKPYKKDFKSLVFKRQKKRTMPLGFKFNISWQLAVGVSYSALPGFSTPEKMHAIVIWIGPFSLVTSWATGSFPIL